MDRRDYQIALISALPIELAAKSTFWLDASTEVPVRSTFETLARVLEAPVESLHTQELMVSYVLEKLRSWSNPCLLIFDSYDDPRAFSILDCLPQCEKGSILVTSRHAESRALVDDETIDFFELPGLDDDAAVALLLQQSGARSSSFQDAALAVVKRLGNHALAISQAGAYIVNQKIDVNSLLDHFDRRKSRILKTTPRLTQYRRKLGEDEEETALNVFTTWELSFQHLQSQSDDEDLKVNLMALLSLFESSEISEELFRAYPQKDFDGVNMEGISVLKSFCKADAWDHDLFVETMVSIEELSLLEVLESDKDEDKPCLIRMHPLVQDWIRLRTDNATLSEMVWTVIMLLGEFGSSSWNNNQFGLSLRTQQGLLRHILLQVENWEEFSTGTDPPIISPFAERLLELQHWVARFLTSLGFFKAAKTTFHRTCEAQQRVLGAEHPDTLLSKSQLAVIYTDQGRWKEAETLTIEVLEARNRVLGEDHLLTLMSLGMLAAIYWDQGRLEEAETLELDVLEKKNRVLGEEHIETLISTNNLACTYWKQERWKEAEALELAGLEKMERVLEEEHPFTLISMGNLASIYRKQERWEDAERLELEAIEKKRRVLGEEHPNILTNRNNLVSTYFNQGRWKEAEKLGLEVIEKEKRLFGEEHLDTLRSPNNRAYTLFKLGRIQEAWVPQSVYALRIKVLGPNDSDTQDILKKISDWKEKNNTKL